MYCDKFVLFTLPLARCWLNKKKWMFSLCLSRFPPASPVPSQTMLVGQVAMLNSTRCKVSGQMGAHFALSWTGIQSRVCSWFAPECSWDRLRIRLGLYQLCYILGGIAHFDRVVWIWPRGGFPRMFSPPSVQDAERLLPDTLGRYPRRSACTRSFDCLAVGCESQSSSCSARCSASIEAVSAWKAWLDRVTPRTRGSKVFFRGSMLSVPPRDGHTPQWRSALWEGVVPFREQAEGWTGSGILGAGERNEKEQCYKMCIKKWPKILASNFPDMCPCVQICVHVSRHSTQADGKSFHLDPATSALINNTIYVANKTEIKYVL